MPETTFEAPLPFQRTFTRHIAYGPTSYLLRCCVTSRMLLRHVPYSLLHAATGLVALARVRQAPGTSCTPGPEIKYKKTQSWYGCTSSEVAVSCV
eukprot:3236799-Rhodomonas_salina.1